MTTILSWNIQYGRGCDGRIDLERIAARIRALCDADLICLQEIAAGFDEIAGGADQFAALAALFPEHRLLTRPALEWLDGARTRRFGNLVLTRCPPIAFDAHPLPRPADPAVPHMQRNALEAVVGTPAGALRVATVHLEYHSATQRAAQVERIRALQHDWQANERAPARPKPGSGVYDVRPAAIGTVWCGDFNLAQDDPLHARLLEPLGPIERRDTPDGARLVDAWTHTHPDEPHAPTCGIFDRRQWPQGPHTRDFFLVSAALAPRIAEVQVDVETDASDHQPLVLRLRD